MVVTRLWKRYVCCRRRLDSWPAGCITTAECTTAGVNSTVAAVTARDGLPAQWLPQQASSESPLDVPYCCCFCLLLASCVVKAVLQPVSLSAYSRHCFVCLLVAYSGFRAYLSTACDSGGHSILQPTRWAGRSSKQPAVQRRVHHRFVAVACEGGLHS